MDLAMGASTCRDAAVLAVSGEIDIHSAPLLTARLAELEDSAGTVVVDLTGVEFLDSSALGALVGAHRRATAAGRSLRLVCDRPHILKVFRITRLDEVIPVFDSVEAACS